MTDVAAVPHVTARPRRARKRRAAISPRLIVAIVSLGASIILLFTVGVLVSTSQAALKSRFAVIQHTDDVLFQIAGIQLNLMRMESKIRAYALTNNKQHVDDWRIFTEDTENRLAKLDALVSDNPDQVQRFSALRPRIEERITRWTRFTGMNMQEVPIAELRKDLVGDVQNRPMRTINAGFSRFRAVELGLLQQRQAQADAHQAFLTYFSILLALTAPAFGGAGIYLLVRERNRLRDRELQMQLEHSQRLGLMGETASMLAHEVNQPLAAAKNYLTVLKRGFAAAGSGPQLETAQKAGDQLVRASDILQRLRNFIQKREEERDLESPATLVADAVALLGTISNRCQLHTDIEKGLPAVLVDRVQIQQVLVNLMRNAIEAMENAPRKELWLSVASAPGGMVMFRLRDSGPGLPPQVRERLFQPFTSTKQNGMGVGLSICKRIIDNHGGKIWAETAPESGAMFCFTLPSAAI
jgi:C4-dicarboxylate-specific signal transduction histidine kinase